MEAFVKPLLFVALHTIAIYLFLVVMFRMVGRRQMGQLNVIDLVIIILMGSAVETAMVNGDTSLQAGLVCAACLMLVNRLLARLFLRSKRLRHLAGTGPTLLVQDGRFIEEHLKRAGLTQEDVLEALREREQAGIENVRFAVLETDGAINVVPMEAQPKRGKPIKGPQSPTAPNA